MTNREFYKAISEAEISEDLKQFATDALAKMDERNAKRNSTPSKKSKENEPILAAIRAYLVDHPLATAPEIATACEISTQKASSLCVILVNREEVISTEVKIPKKGKLKAYTLATMPTEEATEKKTEEV